MPLVAVTALAMVGDRDRIMAAGFDGYIPKPISPSAFVSQIELALHTHRAGDPGTPRPIVLVVDDDAESRQYLVTLLGYQGYRVLKAADGAEALALVRAERPQLVLADILMPVIDGYEFVRSLRADPVVAATIVVFCTAHFRENKALELARACGVEHFLTKPCPPEEVLRLVESLLGTPTTAVTPQADFEREHLRLLTDKLAQQAQQATASNNRLNALIELGLRFASEREPQRLLEQCCAAARQLIDSRYALLGVNNGDASPRYFCASGIEAAALGAAPAVAPHSPLGQVVVSRQSLRCRLEGESPSAVGLPAGYPAAASLLAVPVVSPARCYGWLCLLDRQHRPEFSAEDQRLAEILAAQLGRIYENGSLYADVLRRTADLEQEVAERKRAEALSQQQARLAALGADIGKALTQGDTLRDVLGRCTDAMVSHLDAAFACIWTLNPGLNVLELCASSGLPPRLDGPHVRVPVGRFKVGLIAQERRPYLTNAVADDPRVSDPDWTARAGLTSFAGCPLLIDDRLVGVVAMFARQALTETTLQALESVASQIALGIERKRGEETLRLRDRAMAAITQGILITDAAQEDNPIIYANPAAERLSGYEHAEFVGRNCRFLQGADTDRDVVAEMRQAVAATRPVAVELLNYRKDGTPFWNALSISPVSDGGSRVTHFVGVMTDVTERRHLEEKFRQAQKMEAIGRLAGGVAHDFNNLLTVINGYSEVSLSELRPADPLYKSLEQIRKAGERAASLTRQLLTFSRRHVSVLVPIRLNELLDDMARMLHRLIGEDIALDIQHAQELWTVRADTGHLEQVVMNLVVNARDAMPQGGSLTIRTANVVLGVKGETPGGVPAGDYVRLEVSDTGCGMTAAVKARVFEPFFTTKGPEKGTGLGLATVYGIVTQGGGAIELESEPGQGATFRVYLPRIQDDSRRSTPVAAAPRRGTETILVVEDEEGVRTLTRLLLEHAGYKVLQAKNGGEALLLCEQSAEPIALLLTDVVMPSMSGRVLAERLTALRPGIKVLYVSGYTDEALARHGVEGLAFLQKPFSSEALIRKVREVLDQK